MRRVKKTGMMLLTVCMISCACSVVSWADTARVTDDANIISSQAEEELESQLESLSSQYKSDFYVYTIEDAYGQDTADAADRFFLDNAGSDDGAVFCIDMDNRQIYLYTSGKIIRFLTDDRIDAVVDAGYQYASYGEYDECLEAMVSETVQYMQEGIPNGQYTYDEETGEVIYHHAITPLEGLLSLLAGLGGAAASFFGIRSSYKIKGHSYKYDLRSNGRLKLTNQQDRMVNQIVTQRRIPRNPPPSGGGRGGFGGGGGQSTIHTGSSGHSHGGGGRGF